MDCLHTCLRFICYPARQPACAVLAIFWHVVKAARDASPKCRIEPLPAFMHPETHACIPANRNKPAFGDIYPKKKGTRKSKTWIISDV